MTEETVSTLDQFAAPYGRSVRLEDVEYESGLRILRIRIQEGKRFTVLDIDRPAAARWVEVMRAWACDAKQQHKTSH